MLRLNQEKKARLGANWKMDEEEGEQEIKTEYFAGTKMPLNNSNQDLDYGDANAFKARPLKLPRRQYGDADIQVSNTKNPMFVMDQPTGAIVTSKANTLCGEDTGTTGCNPTLVPDSTIAIQEPRDCTDRCNTEDNCLSSEKHALNRVRGALMKNPIQTVNGTEVVKTYYSDSRSYLRNRVRVESTFKCDSDNNTTVKASRIFNPNNSRFNVQGAVSSGTRIADLKRQTKSAYNWNQQGLSSSNFCCVKNNINTVASSRRLGGSDAAPYDEKAKTYVPILGQRTLFRRSTGHKTVCCKK